MAGILTNILHEGVGHGLTALLTGARSGVLTTVAWSSVFDSRLVEAGGTLVNLAAGLLFGVVLGRSKHTTAGGQSGLLWLQYYIPRGMKAKLASGRLQRDYTWIAVAAVLAIVYVAVLGAGSNVRTVAC